MNTDGLIWAIVRVRSQPSRPQAAARDAEKTKAATIRYWTAWDRAEWKIYDLEALNRLRDVAREGYGKTSAEVRRGGVENATTEQHDEYRDRLVEVRVILVAFLTESKVLLDLLSAAVVATLGQPGGFKEKHGSLGIRLDEYAKALGVLSPDPDLLRRAKELDQHANLLRDKVVTHPQMSGEFGRAVMQPRVGSTTDLAVITMYPQSEPLDVIAIEELDIQLEEYMHALLSWLSSALGEAEKGLRRRAERLGDAHAADQTFRCLLT